MKHIIDDTHRIHALSAITYAINDLEAHLASGNNNEFTRKILTGELALENAPKHYEVMPGTK